MCVLVDAVVLMLVLLLLVFPGTVHADQQTGLFFRDGETEGFTLFAPFRGIGTYLIDVSGNIVHHWIEPDGLTPGASIYFTTEGTLLRAVRSEGGGGNGGRIREYEKDGSCIWEFRYDEDSMPAAPGQQHHDYEVLPNGNLLVLAREGNEDTILEIRRTKGKLNKNWDPRPEYPGMGDGTVDFDNTCKRVLDGASKNFKPKWKWSSADHRGAGPRKIDEQKIPSVNFNHIDYLPDRGHILVSCNRCNEIYIIDHTPSTIQASTEAGDLLWRWGNPVNYGALDNPQLGFTHGAHWIHNDDSYGWSGFDENDVGDVILFNNRDPKLCGNPDELCTGVDGFSSVVQLTPPWNNEEQDYGSPEMEDEFGPAGFKRRIVNFTYDGMAYDIDSDFQGSAHLLPNDRIVVALAGPNSNDSTNRAQGDIYELNAAGATAVAVWRYVNPFTPPEALWGQNNGPKPEDIELAPDEIVGICDQVGNFGFGCNNVFRGTKYAPDFEGIAKLD